jgi:hypothetical protein
MSAYANFIEPKDFVRVPMVEDKTNYTEWTRAELDEHNELNP